jgi:arsenate reductase
MIQNLKLSKTISLLKPEDIHVNRIDILQILIDYINNKRNNGEPVFLNFICTHNSRRSQMAQIWAQTAAAYYDVKVKCFSGGVERTAFNERAVTALSEAGFLIVKKTEGENPVYKVTYSEEKPSLYCFSKLYDDTENKAEKFAAVMTCSHADANCPFIPGTEQRMPVTYDDPKEFDGTPQEKEKYRERSFQIATEMFYVFSKINS